MDDTLRNEIDPELRPWSNSPTRRIRAARVLPQGLVFEIAETIAFEIVEE